MRLLDDPAFLSATIGTIYDCVADPSRWEATFAALGDTIGASRGFLGVSTASGTEVRMAVGHRFVLTPEAARLVPLNPLLPLGLIWDLDRAYVASRDYGLPALQATKCYQAAVQPGGDLDAISFVLMREGDVFGHWMLATPDTRAPITEAEARGLELVAPHVRRAVEISNLLGLQRLSAATLQAALDQLDSPVLVLDADRRLVHGNARAEAALARGTVLRPGRDPGTVAGATDAAERALRTSAPGGRETLLTGTDGEERLLFALPLALEGGPAMTLLVLRHPREDTRNPVAIAARAFNLTPAQVQVLAFLAQVHAPEAIAGLLGIGLATVRSHLNELYRRTDTSRQAELVARTLSLASPLRQAPVE